MRIYYSSAGFSRMLVFSTSLHFLLNALHLFNILGHRCRKLRKPSAAKSEAQMRWDCYHGRAALKLLPIVKDELKALYPGVRYRMTPRPTYECYMKEGCVLPGQVTMSSSDWSYASCATFIPRFSLRFMSTKSLRFSVVCRCRGIGCIV